jgi:hypothetical protein
MKPYFFDFFGTFTNRVTCNLSNMTKTILVLKSPIVLKTKWTNVFFLLVYGKDSNLNANFTWEVIENPNINSDIIKFDFHMCSKFDIWVISNPPFDT